MKKVIFLLIAMIGLTSCSSNNGGGAKGKIDCYSIRVTEGGSLVYDFTYFASYEFVYEYISSDGKQLYINEKPQYQKYNPAMGINTVENCTIRVFSDRYTNDYVEYSFSKFIGFLTVEHNYYLDLKARSIDAEIKWSEYKYESDPIDKGDSDNKNAIAFAKKGFYLINNSSIGITDYVSLRLDLTESSLERHTYTLLGEDSIIAYSSKWF